MSKNEFDSLGQEQQTAQDAVRSLPRPVADPEFRARLKAEFVAGRLGADEGAPDKVVPMGAATGRRRAFWSAGVVALAAVLALAVVGLNRLPGPALMAVSGTGTVIIDGTSHPAEAVQLAGLLQPGTHLVVGEDVSLDIQYPGTMVLRVAAGTDMTLPGRPGRWFGRGVQADLAAGEISLRTGPLLQGGHVAVGTPEGSITITGTLVNVFSNGDLSCFCLYEGNASVSCRTGELGAIPANKRWVVYKDGRAPELLDIAAPHLEHMLGMDQECCQGLEGF